MAGEASIHTKTDKDLMKTLTTKESELSQLKLDMRTKEVKDVRAHRRLRREIARIKTVLHAHKLGINEEQR